jgi:hypothetical protein
VAQERFHIAGALNAKTQDSKDNPVRGSDLAVLAQG